MSEFVEIKVPDFVN